MRSLPDTLGIAKAGRLCKAPHNRRSRMLVVLGNDSVSLVGDDRGLVVSASTNNLRPLPFTS